MVGEARQNPDTHPSVLMKVYKISCDLTSLLPPYPTLGLFLFLECASCFPPQALCTYCFCSLQGPPWPPPNPVRSSAMCSQCAFLSSTYYDCR